jgi:hypothetical protein
MTTENTRHSEEKDRKQNPYWFMSKTEPHEDDYSEESGPDSVYDAENRKYA